MIRRLHNLLARVGSLFGHNHEGTDECNLMGLYLDQANRPAGAGMRGAANRERRDGKFAQSRRRPNR